ncbi:MAG: alpha/beta fold hydrolase [Actinomycetota bacterium]|nr:alpha/beta fold hydrolase [Actinomycetota bacterium]
MSADTGIVGAITGRLDAERRRARNGARYLLGLGQPELGQSPRHLVARRDKVRLYRYEPPDGLADAERLGPPLLLVMSLVTRPTVFDLQPGNSLIERFCGAGFDVYLLDWSEPGPADSQNTLETYCDEYLPWAVAATTADAGAETVTMFGYCFGGFLSFLSLAANPAMPVANLVVLDTPIAPERGPEQLRPRRIGLGLFDETGNVPAETMRTAFVTLDPMAELMSYVRFWQKLDDDDYVLAHQVMTSWASDHIRFPGAAARQLATMFADGNPILDGTLRLGGRPVDPGSITVPFLSVVGEKDTIAPVATSEPLLDLVGSADKSELRVPAGHVGLFVGRSAAKLCVPGILDWMTAHSTARSSGPGKGSRSVTRTPAAANAG